MNPRSPITTHVLDISRGKPASKIPVTLERRISDSEWTLLKSSSTGADGRAEDLLPSGSPAAPGVYRLSFDTAAYFKTQAVATFYPVASVVFEVTGAAEHYHVPLLLSPFGYSTYRGT